MHRIICDLTIYRPEPGIAQSGIAAIACTEDDPRRRDALIDRRFRDPEDPRDLFGGPVIEEEVEASAMLFGQTRPARSVVSEKIMRIEHVDTLVKKTAMARPVLADRKSTRLNSSH